MTRYLLITESLFLSILLVLLIRQLKSAKRVAKKVEEVSESNLKYKTVADFAHDGECWEGPDGRFIYVSPSCERITGYTSEELEDHPFQLDELVYEEDRPIWDHHRTEVRDGDTKTVQFRITKKDGSIRWIEHTCCQVVGADKEFMGRRSINRDITEFKEAEQKVWAQREMAARDNRTASMGHLTASIAHELNQPLTGILSNAQASEMMINGGNCKCEEMKEIIEDIISDTKRASDIIRNLRDLYKEQKSVFKPLKINTIVEETVAILHSEMVLKNVELKVNYAEESPIINGNKVQLEQVLINLIVNAQQAMSDLPENERILEVHACCEIPDVVSVFVTDNGPGIDPEKIDSIFEPLVTWKPGGTGMGLAISRSIMEAHQGEMWAENRAERGAKIGFNISIPKEES